jgi:hypothetical protein
MKFKIGGIELGEANGIILPHKFILVLDIGFDWVDLKYYATFFAENHSDVKRFFEKRDGFPLNVIGGGKISHNEIQKLLIMESSSFQYGPYDHRVVERMEKELIATYRLTNDKIDELKMLNARRPKELDKFFS